MPKPKENEHIGAAATRARLAGYSCALITATWLALGEPGVVAAGSGNPDWPGFVLGMALVALLIMAVGMSVFAFVYWFQDRAGGLSASSGAGVSGERSLFHRHPDAVFELNSDSVLVHLNPAACRMLGRAVEELVGARLDAIAAPERVQHDLEQLRATLDGEARVFDSTGLASDGRRIHVQVTSIPKLVDGRVAGVYAIVKNVDAERRMHEQLAVSEGRLRAILDHSLDAVLLSDPLEDRLLECNRAAEQLFGRTEADLRQCSREQVFDTERSDLPEFIRQRDKNGYARGILYLIRPDGSRVPVEASSAMFQDGRGRWRTSVTLRDISERQRHEQELRESERRYRALFEQSADAILLSRPDGTIDHANPAAERMFGCSVKELCRRGRRDLVDEHEPAFQELREKRRLSKQVRGEIHMYRADGEAFLADISIVEFEDGSGQARTSVVVRDVTETKTLYRQVDLLASAFRCANEALLVCDSEWHVLDANNAYEAMAGLVRGDIIGRRPSFLDFGDQSGKILGRIEADGQWRGELLLRDAEGLLITTRAGISEIRGSYDSGRFLVVHLEDISQIREFQRRIDFLSYNDRLTGLPNRAALQHWFDEMNPASVSRPHLAVVYLDLDRFKAINESFGHSVGDKILREIGRRLRAHCGKSDFVARLGGDDFVVVLTTVEHSEHALRRTEHLIRELAMPIEAAGQKIFSSASAGIVYCTDAEEKLEDLLRRADAAHATAKRRGRGQLQLYGSSMQREVEEHALVETHLREALRQGELYLVYQPIVNLHDGRITGLEALVRWNNPELGDVPPARFVPVAEESGLIVELGAWIFDRACAEVRIWLDSAVVFGSLSVNISPAQFQQPDFVDRIAQCLTAHGIAGEHFVIEITENVLMLDPERATEILHQLRDLGMRIAVDDFGTGYSSMAYLRQFPVQCIKLDRAFVSTIPENHVDSTIIRSIIDLAGALDLGLIAEGVETGEQRDALMQWGCNNAQGFLFSKPHRSAAITEKLLANGKPEVARDDAPDPGVR